MTVTNLTAEYLDACPIGRIRVDPINPRTHITVDDDFVASIATVGILEPLIVRVDPAKTQLVDDQGPVDFLLIAGHRRLLAAQQADLPTVPVVVRHDLADDKAALVAMIVENGQRENLPPLDEARGIEQLVGMGMSQREAAKAIGREQGTVSKRLSLLKLPVRAQQLLEEERITVKTALGLTGLVKHNDRMSNVLDYASGAMTPDDADIARWIARELQAVQHEKDRAKQVKEASAKIAALRDGALTEMTDEAAEANESLDYCDDEDENATVFTVVDENTPRVRIYYYKPATDEDDENGDEPENYTDALAREERAAAQQRRQEAEVERRSLIENLVRDGYPGDEDALLHTARLFAVEYTQLAMVGDLFALALPGIDPADDEDDNEVAVIEAINENTARAAFAAALLAGENSYETPVRRQHLAFLMHHGYQPATTEERELLGDTVPDDDELPLGSGETLEDQVATAISEPTADIATVNDDEQPDVEEPWKAYASFGVKSILRVLANTEKPRTPDELQQIIAYEQANDGRQAIIDAAQEKLDELASVNA